MTAKLSAVKMRGDFTGVQSPKFSELQQVVYSLNTSGSGDLPTSTNYGGILQLPVGRINFGTNTLIVPNGVRVSGMHSSATKIDYQGDGVPIVFQPHTSVDGYGRNVYVSDLSIYAPKARAAIGMSPLMEGSEFNEVILRNLIINSFHDVIDLSPASLVYWLDVDHVNVESYGGCVLSGNARGADINRLLVGECHDTLVPPMGRVNLSGNGKIRNSFIEEDGPVTVPAWNLKDGPWLLENTWSEYKCNPQAVFTATDYGAGVFNPTCIELDIPYFVYEWQRIKLVGTIDLSLRLGPQSDWDLSKMTDYIDMDPALARVFANGEQIMGRGL